ncbi:MAG: hypothetical protein QXS48_04105 [Candidatus Aenigmatarchaeota archaeon]
MGAPTLYVVDVIKNILSYISKLIPKSKVRVNELGRGEIFYKPIIGEERKLVEVYGTSERRGESVGNHRIVVDFKDPSLKEDPKLMEFLYKQKKEISEQKEPIELVIK